MMKQLELNIGNLPGVGVFVPPAEIVNNALEVVTLNEVKGLLSLRRNGEQILRCAQNDKQVASLKELLRQNWPEATYSDPAGKFRFTLPELAEIFPQAGIAGGQLIEITGAECSGKTTVLHKMLAALTPSLPLLYVDCARQLFPPAVAAAGNDLRRWHIVQPTDIALALRQAELLLAARQVGVVVFDLGVQQTPLPRVLLHRLRQELVRSQGLAFFVTEEKSRLFPASLISVQLSVTRANRHSLDITATRSRLTGGGQHVRINRERAA